MYKVIIYPSKIPKEFRYFWINNNKDGDIIELNNHFFNIYNKNKGFIELLEHYKMITTSKEKCKSCGQIIIKRKKVIL